jgi:hypothetical protein
MTETFMRHFIAAIGVLIALTIYLGGYFSAKNGWWWPGFGVLIIYFIVYNLVNTK